MSNEKIRWIPWAVLAGDLLAISLFVFTGQRDHNTIDAARPLLGLLRTAFPFLLVWVIVAGLVKAVPLTAADLRLPPLLLRALNGWFVAAPLALMLRAFLLGRGIPPIFMLVTLAAGSAFLLAWRLLFGLIWRQWGGRPAVEPAESLETHSASGKVN